MMEYKTIPGYSKYSISKTGEVISYARTTPIILSPATDKDGYLYVGLSKDVAEDEKKVYIKRRIHTLVAQAYLGYIPPGTTAGFVCDHKDNNKLNNNLDNLQVVSTGINSGKDRVNSTGYTGVSKEYNGKFSARIVDGVKRRHLGTFDSALDASTAYNEARAELDIENNPTPILLNI